MNAVALDAPVQWGKLPFDLFALEKWDSNTAEDGEAQRARLASEFTQLGCWGRNIWFCRTYGRPPNLTQAQIDTILRPLQTNYERNLSPTISRSSFLWLRTFYGPGSDELHTRLLSSMTVSVGEVTNGGAEELLNDPTIYNYGDEWARIFQRFPGLPGGDSRPDANLHQQNIQVAKLEAIEEIEEGEEANYSHVQERSVTSYLFIEDEEALRKGLLLLIWMDEYGQVVRFYRIKPDDGQELNSLWQNGSVYESSKAWVDAEIGAAYREGGPMGPPYH